MSEQEISSYSVNEKGELLMDTPTQYNVQIVVDGFAENLFGVLFVAYTKVYKNKK